MDLVSSLDVSISVYTVVSSMRNMPSLDVLGANSGVRTSGEVQAVGADVGAARETAVPEKSDGSCRCASLRLAVSRRAADSPRRVSDLDAA